MKTLQVVQLDAQYDTLSAESIAAVQQLESQMIGQNNWSADYPYAPDASFKIGYNAHGLFLDFEVSESHLLSSYDTISGDVWEDSCVEFFLSDASRKNYFNFECNCSGVRLLGNNKDGARQLLSDAELEKIQVKTSLPYLTKMDKPEGGSWKLSVFIPASCYPENWLHPGNELTANFYKCGDHCKQVHFLSWNAIKTEQPNFHVPEFFGKLILN